MAWLLSLSERWAHNSSAAYVSAGMPASPVNRPSAETLYAIASAEALDFLTLELARASVRLDSVKEA